MIIFRPIGCDMHLNELGFYSLQRNRKKVRNFRLQSLLSPHLSVMGNLFQMPLDSNNQSMNLGCHTRVV
jgi:hypothetical protein